MDELPQLWNIVRGEMRFIGPRPLTLEDYSALPACRELRCRDYPGITGLAQVNGGQALDPASKLALDLYLLEHVTPGLYLGIVGRSIARLVGLTIFVSVPDTDLLSRAHGRTVSQLRAEAVQEVAEVSVMMPVAARASPERAA